MFPCAPSPAAQSSHTHLVPGPRLPLGRAGHSVAGPAALGPLAGAVLAVHGAVGAVVERLQAAHRAQLVAGGAAGFGAMLPLVRRPAAGVGEGVSDTARDGTPAHRAPPTPFLHRKPRFFPALWVRCLPGGHLRNLDASVLQLSNKNRSDTSVFLGLGIPPPR